MIRKFSDDIFLKVGIYSITNIINNKIYIGSTLKSFKIRFYSHINTLNSNKHDNPYIQKSWLKYGEDNFIFNIVESFDTLELNELLLIEEYYINKYDSLNKEKGYNICHVGKSRHGTKWSEESKKNRCGENNPMFGKGYLRKGELNWSYGKKLSDSHKKNMSISLTNIKKPITSQKLSKPVIMLDKNDNIIKEFSSCIAAQKEMNNSHINAVCNGNRKSAAGFLWKWKNN